MSSVSLVVVDGDLISFKASAACETRTIDVSFAGNFIGNFPNRTNFKSYLKETVGSPPFEEFTITDKQEVEDIANCLHTVKVMLQGIKDATGCSDLKVVVQGDGNFRDELLLPSRYKGDRVDKLKPIFLKQAREYLINKYKAELAHGQESDDVLASYAYEGFTKKQYIVQASTDKDANSNVGWLYNWDKMDKPQLIQGFGSLARDNKGKVSGIGRKWFYHQVLFGDRADSYCPYELANVRFGEKASFDVLNELTDDRSCWQALYSTFKSWYPEDFEYTAWNGRAVVGNAIQQMQLYADCAHMRRFEGDRLDIESILNKMGVEY